MFKKRLVLVGGCFDILHWGHVSFLKKARKFGDFLVIALESDQTTKKLKGKARPIHKQSQRRRILESLRFVDKVISLPPMKTDSDYKKLVLKVKPQIIAVTQKDPFLDKKKKLACLVGAKVVEIPKIKASSTTKIVKLLELE